jgi:hypothetical protein
MTWLTWAAVKALAGNALGKAWAWLQHRSFWQLVAMALAALCLLLAYQRNDARHDRDSYLKQRDYYRGELQRVTSKRDEQHKVSDRTVTQVVRGQDSVRTIVKTIHDAPNPPDCKTPQLPEAARRML